MKELQNRVKLELGKQKELMLMLKNKSGSLKTVALELNIPYSTLKKYSRGEFYLPEDLFNQIVKLCSLKIEELNFQTLPRNWGQKEGGKNGIASLMNKYPEKIKIWRKMAWKKSTLANTKQIKTPELNEELAELIGIYLGDGTLTKYFISISGDCRYDYPYFEYVSSLINSLFGIKTSIRREKRNNTLYLVVYSKELCSYLNKRFDLKYGDKIRNKTGIPSKILNNPKLAKACLRGLIDTDGCVSKSGNQMSIRFSSYSEKILKQTEIIGKMLRIFTFSTGNHIGTTKWKNVLKYFELVGSSNLRHIVRFYTYYDKKQFTYQNEVDKHYQDDKFKNIQLPFKISGPVG